MAAEPIKAAAVVSDHRPSIHLAESSGNGGAFLTEAGGGLVVSRLIQVLSFG